MTMSNKNLVYKSYPDAVFLPRDAHYNMTICLYVCTSGGI